MSESAKIEEGGAGYVGFTDDLEIGQLRPMMKKFNDTISGWTYKDSTTIASNLESLVQLMTGQIERDATRIQNLQLKLGQLVERGP